MKVEKNALEWIVFGFSVLLIGATVTLLVRDALSGKGGPADLRVSIGTPERVSGGFAVPVEVKNVGDTAAEEAHIQLLLVADGKEVEASEMTFAFLPRGSRRDGRVVFRHDPSCCEVLVGAMSYENP
jgi:uncharacterized protein (TIGR02588 family)